MPSRSAKTRNFDQNDACVHLETMNELSYSLQPLCYCNARDLVLGKNALVCSVCSLFKKTEHKIVDLYIADSLEDYGDVAFDDQDFYDVIKDGIEEDEDDEEDEEMPKKRRSRKKKKVEEEEEDEEDEEEKKKKEEEEKISEELFGRKETTEEEPQVEDLEKEIHEVYDRKERKLAKAKEKGIDVQSDEDLELIDDFDEEEKAIVAGAKKKKPTKDLPEVTIELTKDGKQRCPRCSKEYVSVARHITRCKYTQGPEDIEAIKLASSKLKKQQKK